MTDAFNDVFGPFLEYIVNPVIALLFALAMVYFLWGVARFFLNGDSEDERKKGAQHMLWGVIGLGIMLSAFGIMNFILNELHNIQGADRDPTTIPR